MTTKKLIRAFINRLWAISFFLIGSKFKFRYIVGKRHKINSEISQQLPMRKTVDSDTYLGNRRWAAADIFFHSGFCKSITHHPVRSACNISEPIRYLFLFTYKRRHYVKNISFMYKIPTILYCIDAREI